MTNNLSVNVTCDSLKPDSASVFYQGEVTYAGVAELNRLLDSLFGYFKYEHVQLCLESPGGSVEALQYILRKLNGYEQNGRSVSIRSTFMCASAAAVLLAMGQWGARTVDRSARLLFHTARVDSHVRGMTATISGGLYQTLLEVDQGMVDMLVARMVSQSGSVDHLKALVGERFSQIKRQTRSETGGLFDLLDHVETRRSPDWVKPLTGMLRSGVEGEKFIKALKRYLHSRMQCDIQMDLLEAYALCLIDRVDGGISGSNAQLNCLSERVNKSFHTNCELSWG